MKFSPARGATTARTVESVLQEHDPPTSDVQCLVAAARLAFDQAPEKPTADSIVARIVKAAGNSAPAGKSAGGHIDDRATGASLYDLFDTIEKERSR